MYSPRSEGFMEVSPEITLGERSAAGVALGFEYSSGENSLKQDGLIYANWSVIPYYRFYFGKNESASGFFVEPHLAIYEYEDDFSDLFETRFGVGLAIGSKFILKNNWLLEWFAGGGFDFKQEKSDFVDFPEMFPRIGVSVGKRF